MGTKAGGSPFSLLSDCLDYSMLFWVGLQVIMHSATALYNMLLSNAMMLKRQEPLGFDVVWYQIGCNKENGYHTLRFVAKQYSSRTLAV